ncbi:putative quinol monooxygenase [Streptomyces sp. NPDC002870]|uniref:putative quinol monooxygenase n=1 Tax=Streptomyces sp. NPDC002870 TaxID=3364666 RepID=UPI003693C162
MLIVSGRVHVAADARDGYLDGCQEVVTQARSAPGCLDFALSPDLLDPTRVNVYERWESDADLAAFRGSGPDTGQLAAIVDAEVMKYRISATEAP